MFAVLFAHGDPISLAVMLVMESFMKAADNAGPVVEVLLKLVAVLLILPIVVLVLGFVVGVFTAILVRKKRWLFLAVSAEALALYAVFCTPAALLLMDDWIDFWAWLTIGLGGAISMIAGLLNAAILVGIIALFSRLTRKKAEVGAISEPEA